MPSHAQCKTFGQCFAAVGSGGNAAIGRPFVYSGHGSADLMGIWNTIAGNTFDKTAASTVGVAHISDGTTSPYDGQCCRLVHSLAPLRGPFLLTARGFATSFPASELVHLPVFRSHP